MSYVLGRRELSGIHCSYKPNMLSAYRDFKRSASDGPTDWKNDDGGVFGYKRSGNGRFPFRRTRLAHNGLVYKRAPSFRWPFELVDKKSDDAIVDETDDDDEVDDETEDDSDEDETYDSRRFMKKADLHRGRQGEINLKDLGASLYRA